MGDSFVTIIAIFLAAILMFGRNGKLPQTIW